MQKTVLVCPPHKFNVDYVINPWMAGHMGSVDKEKAALQWNNLIQTFQASDLRCLIIDPVDGLPDMVFTANAGLIHPTEKKVLLSNFRYRERRGEQKYFEKWFSEHGYEVYKIKDPDNCFFEGAGDALWYGSTLIVGHGFRTNEKGARQVADFVEGNTLLVKLVDSSFYHLDTCFTGEINKNGVCLYYPAAFNEKSQKQLWNLIGNSLIPIYSERDAKRFVCNAVPAKQKIDDELRDVLITSESTPQLKWVLEHEYDIHMIPVKTSEFLKSGGGARCLTLFLHTD